MLERRGQIATAIARGGRWRALGCTTESNRPSVCNRTVEARVVATGFAITRDVLCLAARPGIQSHGAPRL